MACREWGLRLLFPNFLLWVSKSRNLSDLYTERLRLTLVAVLAPGLGAAVIEAGGRGHDGGDGLTLLRGEVSPQVSPGQPREDGVNLRVTGNQLLQQILGQQLLLWLGHV